jgi:hypothetical protein
MTRYNLLLKSDQNKCQPDLYSVSSKKILELTEKVEVHPDLIEVWEALGFGFFSTAADGSRVTGFTNRLYPPDEIIDTIDDLRNLHESDLPDLGLPFFEYADFHFLAVTPNGKVVDEDDSVVAETLFIFFQKLLADVKFFTR